MVSKKAARKAAHKRHKAKVLKLSEKARAEVRKLLKQQQAGTITGVELETGLEELREHLKLLRYIFASL